jgi:hypothetical protein
MNTVALTGLVASSPAHHFSGFMHRTEFDITVTTARREYTFHVSALNELAKAARRLEVGDRVEITGYLRSEPFDMPDRTVWHRVEIVAYEIDRQPADGRAPAGALR